MKRFCCVLLILLTVFSLVSCGKDREYDQHYYHEDTPSGTEEPSGPSGSTDAPAPEPPEEENPYAEALEAEFPSNRIECGYEDLLEMKRFASVFNYAPAEFTVSSDLSDACKFFAAVTYLEDEFETLDDGFTQALPIGRIEEAVRAVFGDAVGLSSGWMNGEYSPYMIDTENQLVLTYGIGKPNPFYYTWAALTLDNGRYELWLLNLADPLFLDNENNASLVEIGNGDVVPVDAVERIARQMQANVYTFEKSDSGLHQVGFAYKNYKGVPNFLTVSGHGE